jgi:GNAT superfamily N-acetyltransferase
LTLRSRSSLTWRYSTAADLPVLAELNAQLIRDEGHRNRMTVAQLETRMAGWLGSSYLAVLFHEEDRLVAYALYRPHDDLPESDAGVYLRQFFVARGERRRGIGRRAIELLMDRVWPRDGRVTLETLVDNHVAQAFWRAVGFRDYALTFEWSSESSSVEDVIRIDAVTALPPGFDALLSESLSEGLRLLSRLDQESRLKSPPFFPPRGLLLVARRGEALLGICALYPDPFLDDPSVARLRHLYVAPAARRQRVGRLLVEEALRRAEGRFRRIRLRTDSPSAAAFYLAAGFTTTAEEGATHERAPNWSL